MAWFPKHFRILEVFDTPNSQHTQSLPPNVGLAKSGSIFFFQMMPEQKKIHAHRMSVLTAFESDLQSVI